jgi:hypothetical protein
MCLDHEVRLALKAEVSRIRKSRLLKLPRGIPAGGNEPHRTEASAEAPWFPIRAHRPLPAHRTLPSLDVYDQAA